MHDRPGGTSAERQAGRSDQALPFDPSEPLSRLRRELATGPDGLSAREAARRLAVHGPNEVERKARSSFVRELTGPLIHPLALLLWAAAALAFVTGLAVLGWAVIAVNAAFALLQERQAERAVDTLARYLPEHALVVRDGRPLTVEARELVPGDVILLEEGDKVPADARLAEGGVEVDLSMLTGESVPAERIAAAGLHGAPLLEEPNLVFSGTTCVEGQARAVVFERAGKAAAGLPTITLALAVGVRALARGGALVKRLSAVETLGSTSVICTDKTGTLTRNRMPLRTVWTPGHGAEPGPWSQELVHEAALCTTVTWDADGEPHGAPTEVALVTGAAERGVPVDTGRRDAGRRALFRFGPRLRMMSVVREDDRARDRARIVVKGAPEAILPRLRRGADADGARAAAQGVHGPAGAGTRVLAVAVRDLLPDTPPPSRREDAESDLALLGLVGLYDPPRSEVAAAVGRRHEAGVRVHVVTGDNGATAAAVAREVGIGVPRLQVVAASEALDDDGLDALAPRGGRRRDRLRSLLARDEAEGGRHSPGARPDRRDDGRRGRRALAPHRAHIGVAMGRSGTDVAREAAAMVRLFGTAALPADVVLLIVTFPVLVWGTDELRRGWRRRHGPGAGSASVPPWSRRNGG
ncbi:cation-transporting P-type ATPase [Streptomyces sp. NPDC093111]|uniref:P-type ATPase n=1 Tax=Streptomyces sp. NPDC093111 TaxID=3154978 RepID=UPI00341F31A7